MKRFLVSFIKQLTVLLGMLALLEACVYGYSYFFMGGTFSAGFYVRMLCWLISSSVLMYSVYLTNRGRFFGVVIPALIVLPFALLKGFDRGYWYLLILPASYVLVIILLALRKPFIPIASDQDDSENQMPRPVISDKWYWSVPLWGFTLFLVLTKIITMGFGLQKSKSVLTIAYLSLAISLVIALVFIRLKRGKIVNVRATPGIKRFGFYPYSFIDYVLYKQIYSYRHAQKNCF